MQSPSRDLRIGLVLSGRYRITALLGEGGMGLVYRGERLQLGRPVAIKFLHGPYAKSPKYQARFEREARAMSKLSHPYLVSVIDFGVHEEPYIVMDFVTGLTLRDLMDRERIGSARAIQITRQILAGLSHAHGQGVVHRDIKPGNVMVGEATGMGDHVRIFDFGLAKLHDPTAENDQSMATVIGTPAYMAPEQTRAESIDARADLYAVGILLFEMLTGDKPFVGDDAYEVIRLQREEPAPLLRTRAPALSRELEQVVQKALEKLPDQRYQTAAEFAQALDAVPEALPRAAVPVSDPSEASGRELSLAALDTPLGGPSPTTRRRALLGLGLVAAVGLFAFLSTRFGPSEPAARGTEQAVEARPVPPSPTSPPTREPAPGPAPAVVDAPAPALDAPAPEPVPPPAEGARDPDALTDEELAAADRALSETEEREAHVVAGVGPEVRSISDVYALIDQKQVDAAILGLRALRQRSPYNPYLSYLLGDLYFERGFWGDGLAKYREALELNDGYRKRTSIHDNAIRALESDATYARARVLLLRDLGQAALSSLAQASVTDPSLVIQRRARLVAGELAAARRKPVPARP